MNGTIYKTDGKTVDIEIDETDNILCLETLRNAVSGYIEVVRLFDRHLIINEEGKLFNLPYNPFSKQLTKGTRYEGADFFGDVVLLNGFLD